MKYTIILICAFLYITCSIKAQGKSLEKYYFDITANAENLSGSSDEVLGLKLNFEINNKDLKIGKGRGWLVYNQGALVLDSITKVLYPIDKLKGYSFIKSLFIEAHVLFNSDTITIDDFDIYFYSIEPKYLELKQNNDGEGAGKTYSFYENYPCIIKLYKKTAGNDFFETINSFEVLNEDEFIQTSRDISNFKKVTYNDSNTLTKRSL